jgi:hypothetical protein
MTLPDYPALEEAAIAEFKREVASHLKPLSDLSTETEMTLPDYPALEEAAIAEFKREVASHLEPLSDLTDEQRAELITGFWKLKIQAPPPVRVPPHKIDAFATQLVQDLIFISERVRVFRKMIEHADRYDPTAMLSHYCVPPTDEWQEAMPIAPAAFLGAVIEQYEEASDWLCAIGSEIVSGAFAAKRRKSGGNNRQPAPESQKLTSAFDLFFRVTGRYPRSSFNNDSKRAGGKELRCIGHILPMIANGKRKTLEQIFTMLKHHKRKKSH